MMNRRAFLRSLLSAVAVVTVAPTIFNEAVVAAVGPTNPIFSSELGWWFGVVIHETDSIPAKAPRH